MRSEIAYSAYKAIPRMDSKDIDMNYDFDDLEIKFSNYVSEKELEETPTGTLEEPSFHKRN